MKSILTAGFTAIIVAVFFIVSCHKSSSPEPDEPDVPDTTSQPLIEYVTASITGRVVDNNNLPVNGAVVKAGTASTTTDIDGNFSFSNVSFNKNAAYVKVIKDGFFEGSRTIETKAGLLSYVSMQLIKKTMSGTVSGSSGGNVTVPGGGSIIFAGNSFVNTAGNSSYTGTVSVSTYFINSTASNFTEIMPGTLRGINTAREEKGLKSFGMFAIELTGAGGEKLQLAAGQTATLTIPIPAYLQAQAPATIPLWSFNDTTGLWKEEGIATKQGTNYVGTVSHFSFWNASSSYSMIDVKAVLIDINLVPLYPVKFEFKSTDSTWYSSGYTDSTGLISGKIPSGEAGQLKIVLYKCLLMIIEKNIGPNNTATDLGTIKTEFKYFGTVVISGTVKNCNALPVTNGFVDIFIDNAHNTTPITNGNFKLAINRCTVGPTTATITAYDLGANKIGITTNIAITPPTASVGAISACTDSLGEYFNFTVEGINVSYLQPIDTLEGYYLQPPDNYFKAIARRRPGPTTANRNMIYIAFTGAGTGPAPLSSAYIVEGSQEYVLKIGGQYGNVNVTEFDSPGGYCSGNFTGQILRHPGYSDSLQVPVTITFRVKRRF